MSGNNSNSLAGPFRVVTSYHIRDSIQICSSVEHHHFFWILTRNKEFITAVSVLAATGAYIAAKKARGIFPGDVEDGLAAVRLGGGCHSHRQ